MRSTLPFRIAAEPALVVMALATAPAHADQVFGQPQADSSTRVQMLGGPPLALLQGGGYIAAPNAVQVKGTSSTEDVSSMSVTPSVPNAVPRTQADRSGDGPTLNDFGASPDATPAENCTALSRAAEYGKLVRIPEGTYKVNCASRAVNLEGAGEQRTVLMNLTPDQPTLTTDERAQFPRIVGMTLDRSVPATAGGNGLVARDGANAAIFSRVRSQNNYDGFSFGITALSTLDSLNSQYNKRDGYHFESFNTSNVDVVYQWNFTGRSLAQANTRDGYFATINPGGVVHQAILGQWSGLFTFANGRDGVHVEGKPQAPIQDLRLIDYFIGADQRHGIYLDTYGEQHAIGPGFLELARGSNIYLTAHNAKVTIKTDIINGAGNQNIYSMASNVDITGVTATNPGQSTPSVNVYLGGPYNTVYGGSTVAGTWGVLFDRGAKDSTIMGTAIRKATNSPGLSAQPDTIVRGVRGTAKISDAN